MRENMKITVIAVGKIKEKYLVEAIKEYSKRLSRYCKLEIIEVADEKTPDVFMQNHILTLYTNTLFLKRNVLKQNIGYIYFSKQNI